MPFRYLLRSNAVPVLVAIQCRSGTCCDPPRARCPPIHVADWFVTVQQAAQLPSTRLERVQHANRSDRARHFGSQTDHTPELIFTFRSHFWAVIQVALGAASAPALAWRVHPPRWDRHEDRPLKHVRANTPNPENAHIQANRLSSGALKRGPKMT
jgi:hypothetical protein